MEYKQIDFSEVPYYLLSKKYWSDTNRPFAAAVMLAIYLGFEKVHLVGFDYTHHDARSMHWYERGKGLEMSFNPIEHELKFLKIAQEFIDITTVTLEGGSPLLPSVTYEALTGKSPAFKENDELTQHDYLVALARRSPYHIF